MTYKNAKMIFVAVLAIGLLGGGIVATQNVEAESPTNIGKSTIKSDIPKFNNPSIKQTIDIMKKLNEDTIMSSDEKSTLMAELQQIKKEYTLSTEQRQLVTQKEEILTNYLSEQLTTKGFKASQQSLPITGYYVDDVTGALVIHVDAIKYSDELANSVLSEVRSLVGNYIDVVIEPMTPITTQGCSQTGNCEPAQAGVKISTNVGPCSIGFKASYDGKTGFMTAGHCTNGGTNSGIGQPNYVFWDDIGTAYANSLIGSSTTYDGLFVDANENISDKVYLDNDITYAGNVGYLDGVVMEGHVTKGVFGIVLISSYNGYIGNVLVNDMGFTNYVGDGGDSGGVVYGIIPYNHLLGTHSGKLIGYDYSVFSKQQNAVIEFPGLTWEFN